MSSINNANLDDINIQTSEIEPKDETDAKCAPGKMFEDGSCITLNNLLSMANAYNKENSHKLITLYKGYEALNPKKYKKYLIKSFNSRFQQCDTQKCWLEQSFIKFMKDDEVEQLENYTFRPEGPSGKFEWLNTLHINEVMDQYENYYKDFKFLGAVPIDFDELTPLGIKNLNYKKLVDQGIYKLGIVFNLDEHYKKGSHWVAMFSNLKDGGIFFYDSYAHKSGDEIDPRIRKLMRRIAKFCQTDMGIKHPIVDYNKIRHQYGNSECGVYSMHFILRMLKGESFEDICKSKTTDKQVNECRKTYFKNVN
jgi:hypothetical protein